MNVHFWMHLAGLLLYVVAMWAAGITEGLMWRATGSSGELVYGFLESLIAVKPLYLVRLLGGLLVLGGMVVMGWNLWHTAANARAKLVEAIRVPAPLPLAARTAASTPAAG
jgi:cytochrome c oxidase cbb3-type subunit 1